MAVTPYMIKKFGVLSVAKFFAVFGIIWGFFMGLFMAFGINRFAYVMGQAGLGAGLGIAGLLLMILFGAIAGFIGGAIVAVVYNLVLGAIGGIEMDLEAKT